MCMGATRQRELTLQLGRKRVSISDELLTVVVSFLRTRPVWPARQLVSLACDRFSEQGREEAGSGRGNRMTACGMRSWCCTLAVRLYFASAVFSKVVHAPHRNASAFTLYGTHARMRKHRPHSPA